MTICTTIACNFDCPYCFEERRAGKMGAEVADDVCALAGRMLDASGARRLVVTWYGGEPLLAHDVIESLSERLIGLVNERGVAYEAQVVTNGYLLTPEMADLLARSKVTFAQITVDGIGVTHDLTRRLVGGGGTFERIIENISRPGLPLGVRVRHNVHEGYFHEVGQVEELMRRIAEVSGNRVMYYAEPVLESDVAEAYGEQVRLLDRDRAAAIRLRQGAPHVPVGIDHTCTAQNMWALLVDEMGNLHKCAGMTASDPESAFGHAHDWDPRDPIGTASRPDNITRWLNTAMPVADEECAECVWLLLCGGGCPHYRLQGRRMCPPFKDDSEAYVLSRYEYLQKRRKQTPSWIGRPIAG